MVKTTTQERLAVIETKLETIQTDVADIKKALKEHVEWEDHKYKELDKKYASKIIEKIVYALVGGVLIYTLNFVLEHTII